MSAALRVPAHPRTAGARGASPTLDPVLDEQRLRRLKWLTILLPLAFLSLLHYLLHSVLYELHDFPQSLALLPLVAAGIAVFSWGVFRVIDGLERRIVERSRELEAMLAVATAGSSSLELEEVLRRGLAATLDVTPAERAEAWLVVDGGLTLAAEQGVALDAAVQHVALGEGAPGLAALGSEPLLIEDVAADERWADAPELHAGFRTYCALPLRHRSETVGVLAVASRDPQLCDEGTRQLLNGVGEQLASAIANSSLHERLLESAVLEERARIGREFHDGLGQLLGYLNTETLAVKKLVASGRTDEAERELGEMHAATAALYADARAAIFALRALTLGEGLIEGLRSYALDFRRATGILVRIEPDDGVDAALVPRDAEVHLARIVQEALNNARKHAEASRVDVFIRVRDSQFVIEVSDDGRGFDITSEAGRPGSRFGLDTMRERAEAIGGEFEIQSTPGGGSRVVVTMPLKVAVPEAEHARAAG